MAKGIDDQLDQLTRVRSDPKSPDATAAIEMALKSRTNVVAARAASIVETARLDSLEPALLAAFDRFFHETDKACIAKTAIAKALLAVESSADQAFLAGSRHVQRDTPGQDAAVELRAACAVALVNMRSRQAMPTLVRHLADREPFVRAAAVRSLAAHGGDAAEALVRFKLLIGDKDPAVVADCFPAVVALTRSAEAIEPYLDSEDDRLRESAMLSIGESRLPEAYELLRRRWDREAEQEVRKVLAVAIALTRQPAATDFLISLIAQSDVRTAELALSALAIFKNDNAIRSRVRAAARERGGDVLVAFGDHFPG